MSKMNKKFKELISDSSKRDNTDRFETITFRPSPKVSAMMDAYLRFTNDPASTAFTDLFSEQLAIQCEENAFLSGCVLNSFKEFYGKETDDLARDSSLGIMVERGLVSIERKNSLEEEAKSKLGEIFGK